MTVVSRDRAVVAVERAAREAVGPCARCSAVPRVTARALPFPPKAKGTPWIVVTGRCACPAGEARGER